jgi:hypothetical protein
LENCLQKLVRFGFSPGRPGVFIVVIFSFHLNPESSTCLVASQFCFCPVSGQKIVLPHNCYYWQSPWYFVCLQFSIHPDLNYLWAQLLHCFQQSHDTKKMPYLYSVLNFSFYVDWDAKWT